MRTLRYGLALLLLVAATPLLAQPVFTDITDGDLLTDIRSWGASWVDADSDGDLDLFASRFGPSGGNELFVNEGGTFTRLTGSVLTDDVGSIGHSWADFDNDGDLDVWTAGGGTAGFGNTGGPSILYRNDGNLTFTIVADGPVGPAANNLGWSTAWGDIDGDRFVDAVIAHPAGFLQTDQENHLFLNGGDGTFTRVTDSPIVTGLDPYTIPSWSDYDLDGDADLFIGSGPANGSLAPDNLYENDGDGTFTRIETQPIATDAHDGQVMNWIDFDNDGDLDHYVTNYFLAANALYRNDAGTYVRITDSPLAEDVTGASLANTWGDLDNDGDLDVIVTNGRTGTADGQNNLYLNDGTGTFERVEGANFVTFQESTSGATLGDYDGDGDLDLATTSPSATTPNLRLWRNDLDNANGWLKLRLIGMASNRSAIGAKVRATATIGGSAVTQFREVSAQNTFAGQNALTVHFGLGDADEVATLEVVWPSGTVDTFTDLAAGVSYEVNEGGNIIVANESGEAGMPEALSLTAAYPNPFAEAATIRYTVPAGPVRLAVFDVLGRRVRTLADRVHPASTHTVTWDGTDENGRTLSAGVYFYRLEAGGETLSRSLTLLR